MTRPRRHTPPIALLAALATTALGGCGSGEPSVAATDQRPLRHVSPSALAPGTENQLLAERQWLDRIGPSTIGDAYACASLSPRRRPWTVEELRFVVFITDEAVRPRVRALAGRLSAPTRIRLISPRWRMSEMRRIRREAEATRPTGAWTIAEVPFMELERGCPPIEVTYGKGDPDAAATERWASRLQAAHGTDRVRVRRLARPRPQVVEWSLARKPRADDKTLSLLVDERACASGKSAQGRVHATVRYRPDAVIATIRVRPLPGPQTCQGSPPTPYTLELSEAVGDREILDGGDSERPREPKR